jgi:hypothetical protein
VADHADRVRHGNAGDSILTSANQRTAGEADSHDVNHLFAREADFP